MAPKDEAELQRMLVTCLNHDGPAALRIPRGSGEGVPLAQEGWKSLPIGKGEVLVDGDDLLIVAYGSMVSSAIKTANILKELDINSTVINARFLRPLDESLIHPLAKRIGRVVTIEEGALPGGFGSAVVESLSDKDLFIRTLRIGIPDQLIDHASPDQSKVDLGLTPDQMALRIKDHFNWSSTETEIPICQTKQLA